MSLSNEYQQQLSWRSWEQALDLCPIVPGQTVLDLGCGPGDVSGLLSARGCIVTGVDGNPELLDTARAQNLPQAHFILSDLRALELNERYDGIWCSFAAAYFPTDIADQLKRWASWLKPGGWICLIEIDQMFAHQPVSAQTAALLKQYTDQAYQAGRYDFRMGRRLSRLMQESGLRVTEHELPDQELAFAGPARPDVQAAWGQRFERLGLLRQVCGEDYLAVKTDFLNALISPEHVSGARVVCCVGRQTSD